jgi:hypothetical protein
MRHIFLFLITTFSLPIVAMEIDPKIKKFASLRIEHKNGIIPVFFVSDRYVSIIKQNSNFAHNETLLATINSVLLKNKKSERQLATQAFILSVDSK